MPRLNREALAQLHVAPLSERKPALRILQAVWTPLIVLCGLAFAVSGAQAFEDIDNDGVDDPSDNCVQDATHYPNPEQTNADFDRFGNVCDGDLNQDGLVTQADLTLLEGETDAGTLCQEEGLCRMAADLDESGSVDAGDVTYFQSLPTTPGPAGDNAHKDDPDSTLSTSVRDRPSISAWPSAYTATLRRTKTPACRSTAHIWFRIPSTIALPTLRIIKTT